MSHSTNEQPKYAGPISGPHRSKLPNMNQFVITGNVEGGVSLPEDRVAEGQGQRALCLRKPMQEPLHAAAVELDDAATNAGPAPRAETG